MSNVLTFSGYSLNLGSGYVCGSDMYVPDYRYLTISTSGNGAILSNKSSGVSGELFDEPRSLT